MIWKVILVALNTFRLSSGITGSGAKPPLIDKPYMVYLTKAAMADVEYDAWICGGTLVSKMDIITSAACLEDVKYMYAIAGYRMYVKHDAIKSDMCTRNGRKKVILTCVPKNYQFAYDKIDKWSGIDIGVARVESEYDFSTIVEGCSYAPNKIDVNYDLRFQEAGKEGFILGWGHTQIWRNKNDNKDYNNLYLLAGSTKIISKALCLDVYKRPQGLRTVIQRFMICANGTGSIDSDGNPEDNSTMFNVDDIGPDGCTPEKLMRGGFPECKNIQARRNVENGTDTFATSRSRRAGICQNDHGGPLVAHIGSRDRLIGVASVFRINKESNCVGPYLYTSTACSSAFLRCVLDKILWKNKTSSSPVPEDLTRRGVAEVCNLNPAAIGFDSIDERSISWRTHPDGPAANERIVRNTDNENMHIKRDGLYPRRPVSVGPQTSAPRNEFRYRPQVMSNRYGGGNGALRSKDSDLVFRPQRPIKG